MTDTPHNCNHDDRTESDIEKYGLSVIILDATEYLPAFAYSVGLWKKFNHPEIICFGLTTKNMHVLINDVAEIIKSGQTILIGKKYDDFFTNVDVEFLKVDSSYLENYFGYGLNFYKVDNFPALQLVWTDRKNNFPWDKEYEEEFKFRQPLLDRNVDFKFREEKNLGIFTTTQWLDLKQPILHVVHDKDGDWQFLTGDQMPDDIKLVCLEDIVSRDKTLNEIFNLGYGQEAERKFIGGQWTRSGTTDEDDSV